MDTDLPLDALAEEFLQRYRRGERPAVSEYAGRHPELADEVRELFPLLVQMEGARSELKSSADAGLPAPGPLPIQVLGDYRIIREVGRGGMGVVYEAEQVSLGRRVALKVLPPHLLANQKHYLRFAREARAAAQLHHTNIVPVFGVGQAEGYHFYVMQFIPGLGLDEVLVELRRMQLAKSGDRRTEGAAYVGAELHAANAERSQAAGNVAQSLMHGRFERTLIIDPQDQSGDSAGISSAGGSALSKTRLRDTAQGRLSETLPNSSSLVLPGQTGVSGQSKSRTGYWQSVARIGVQVADAIEYAHEQRIIHRDVKPGNLLLENSGKVWVSDFGLAKASEQQDLTQTGDVLGTLRYMSPEQLAGKADARSDVYSLGLTLYELLALKPAFDESSRHQLVKQVTSETPPRLRTVNPSIPRDLETIVEKAIEKEPRLRYQTAGELADDLRRYLGDEPIRARRISPAARFARWCRRNPALASTSIAVVLLLMAVAGVSAVGYQQTSQALSQLETKQGELKEKSDEAEQNAADATEAARLAEDNARQARQNAARAEQSAEIARENEQKANDIAKRETAQREALQRQLYVAQMNVAARAWEAHNAGRTLELLEALTPEHTGGSDLRGWEWHHLWRLCHSERQSIGTRSDNACVSLAYSPDGTRLLHANYNHIFARSADASEVLQTLNDVNERVDRMAFSRDGRLLATSSESGHVRLRDGATGDLLRSFPGVKRLRYGMALSPDGTRIAIAPDDIQIWSTNDGELVSTLHQDGFAYKTLAFRADGSELIATTESVPASAHDSGESGFPIHLWDVDEGRVIRTFAGHATVVRAIALSPDEKLLASGDVDGDMRLWDAESGTELRQFAGHSSEIAWIDFSPDGQRMLSTGNDATVRIWVPARREPIQTLSGHASPNTMALFAPGGDAIVSGGFDGTLRVWDTASRQEPWIDQSLENTVIALRYSADGRYLAARDNRQTAVYDAETRLQLWSVAGGVPWNDEHHADKHRESARLICFDPAGEVLAVARTDGQVALRDARTGRLLRRWTAHSGPATSVDFSADGTLLATGGTDARIGIWDAETGQQIQELTSRHRKILDVEFLADHRFLAASPPGEGEVAIWDRSTSTIAREIGGGAEIIRFVFSHDGKRMLTSSRDELDRIWDVESGALLSSHRGGNGSPTSLAITGDDSRLASCSGRTVRIWDIATEQEVQTLQLAAAPFSVAFSPDGTRLVAGAQSGTLATWDARPLSPELRREILAAELVRELIPQAATEEALLSAITARSVLDESVRDQAVEIGRSLWETRAEHALAMRVEALFNEKLLRSAVIEALQRDESLSAADRERAVAWANEQAEGFEAAIANGQESITDPSRSTDEYTATLQRADQIIEIEPRRWMGHVIKGGALLRLGREDEAIPVLRQAKQGLREENGSGHPLASSLLALALKQQATGVEDARAQVLEAQQLMRDKRWSDDARCQLVFREASLALEVGLPYAVQQNNDAWPLVVRADASPEMTERGLAMARKATALAPEKGIIWNTLGVAYFRSGKWQPALGALRKSSALRDGGDSADWYFIAMTHWHLGDPELARKWNTAADLWMAIWKRDNAELTQFRREAADLLGIEVRPLPTGVGGAQLAQALLDADPGNTTKWAWESLMKEAIHQERWDDAKRAAIRLTEILPDDLYQGFQLSTLLARARDVSAYRSHCLSILKQLENNSDPVWAERFSKTSLLLPNIPELVEPASRLAERALRDDPNDWLNPFSQVAAALAAYRRQDFQACLDLCDQALRREAEGYWFRNAEARFLRAMALAHDGQMDAAREEFNSAAALVQKVRDESGGRPYDGWIDFSMCELLEAEATEILNPSAKAPQLAPATATSVQ